MQRRIGTCLGTVAAVGLAVTAACGSPAPVREIPPQAAAQPAAPAAAPSGAAAPVAKPDLKKALSEPLPMRDQRPPWQVFFDSPFYHESVAGSIRAYRAGMEILSTYLPHLFSTPEREHEANPMLKAKAARVEERREARREAQAHHNKRRR